MKVSTLILALNLSMVFAFQVFVVMVYTALVSNPVDYLLKPFEDQR